VTGTDGKAGIETDPEKHSTYDPETQANAECEISFSRRIFRLYP